MAANAPSHSMKKLINKVDDLVPESLAGLEAAHPDLVRVDAANNVVFRKDAPKKGDVAAPKKGDDKNPAAAPADDAGGGEAKAGDAPKGDKKADKQKKK